MATKEPIVHKDKLGRILKIGDCVVYPNGNSLDVGTVKKLNPKMVGVQRVGVKHSWGASTKNKYPNDVVVVDGPEVTMYLLKLDSAKKSTPVM